MSRALITLSSAADRERAVKWIGQAKPGTRVEFKQAKRSGEQNDKLWATLTDVAAQVPWHGIKLHADDWKFIFLDALKRELRVVPNIDGTGFVNLGRSSSDLSKGEMSDLIELIHAFGAQHGVVFHEPDSNSPEPSPQTAQSEVPATPAADVSPQSVAAGTPSDAEASTLADDWRDTYLTAMRRVNDRPKSLPTRHAEALQLIGGKANASEQDWMRAVYKLTERRLKGEITPDDFTEAVREIA